MLLIQISYRANDTDCNVLRQVATHKYRCPQQLKRIILTERCNTTFSYSTLGNSSMESL